MAKIQITWYSWLEFLFFFFLPLEDHEDIMLGMGAVGHICPLRCGYPSREARCLYTRGTWCIPVKANKMVSLWGARGQPIHNTPSLSYKLWMTDLPMNHGDGVTYISQTLHKPLQVYFLKYMTSHEYFSRHRREFWKTSWGWDTKKYLDRNVGWEMLGTELCERR